jgi:hypothetical protein
LSHRRPRAIDAIKVARVSDRIGRAWCGGTEALEPIAAAEKREQPRLRGPQANLIVMRPIDENRDDALIFTGIGSLFTAIAAVLLDYPMFATIFAFFSAFAVAVALRNEWEHRR